MREDVHDSQLLGYSIDEVARRIVVHTLQERPREFVDVVFEEVLAYRIQGWKLGHVILLDLFDFDAVDGDVAESRSSIPQTGDSSDLWHTFGRDELVTFLEGTGANVFLLMRETGYADSYIAAASCRFVAVNAPVEQG